MRWLDTFIYGKTIPTIALANTSLPSHNFYFFFGDENI